MPPPNPPAFSSIWPSSCVAVALAEADVDDGGEAAPIHRTEPPRDHLDVLDEVEVQHRDRPAARALLGIVVDVGDRDAVDVEAVFGRAAAAHDQVVGPLLHLDDAREDVERAAQIAHRPGSAADLLRPEARDAQWCRAEVLEVRRGDRNLFGTAQLSVDLDGDEADPRGAHGHVRLDERQVAGEGDRERRVADGDVGERELTLGIRGRGPVRSQESDDRAGERHLGVRVDHATLDRPRWPLCRVHRAADQHEGCRCPAPAASRGASGLHLALLRGADRVGGEVAQALQALALVARHAGALGAGASRATRVLYEVVDRLPEVGGQQG